MDIDMDIKELEAFVYVVENCSFSRAAELLHLTQPTISSHVSALERKLNIKLIVRTTKETYPSDAGKLLYKYAKEILQVRENAAIALRNFSQEMKGTISIAASTVPSQYYLPHLLQNFHEKYPDIAFNIQMEDSPKVIEMVATRAVEIGFSGTRVENHKCISQEFAGDCMAVITPNTEKFRAYAGRHLPKELLLMFDASDAMLEIGAPALRIMSLAFIFAGISIVAGSSCQAFGYSVYSMLISIARQIVVLIPAAYLLSLTGVLRSIWFAFPIAEIFSLILSLFFLRTTLKKTGMALPKAK